MVSRGREWREVNNTESEGVLSSIFTVNTSRFDGEDRTQKRMESCMASITPPPLVALSVRAIILKFDERSSLFKM